MPEEDLARHSEIQLLEVTLDGFMTRGGERHLAALAQEFTLITHSLNLNLASPWGPDRVYLLKLRKLLDIADVGFHTDHLAVTGTPDHWFPQLTPPLLIAGDFRNARDNVLRTQEALGRPIAMENISNFFQPYSQEELIDFLATLCIETDAGVLLDVENLYANWLNFGGVEPERLLDRIPPDLVVGLHIAGGRVDGRGFYVDTHDSPPLEVVMRLAETAALKFRPKYAIFEFDAKVPAVADLARLCASWRMRVASEPGE